MNETEIERIAAAINLLRPDWPAKSLRTLLGRSELCQRPRRDVAVALVWVACDSETKSPARVIEAGPWWRAAAGGESLDDRAPRPPKPDQACRLCGRHIDRCICGQQEIRPPRRSEHIADHAAAARAELMRANRTEETA